MTRIRRWGLTALVVTASGCGDAAGTPAHIVPDHEVSRPFPAIRFAGVRDVVRTSDGLWVLDREPPFLTLFPIEDASEVRQFGRRGTGPAELEAPVAMFALRDRLIVRDAARDELVAFSIEGDASPSDIDLETEGWVRPDFGDATHLDLWRLRRLGDVSLHTATTGSVRRPSDLTHASLIARGRGAGGPLLEVDFTPLSLGAEDGYGFFTAVPLWDACGETAVVWSPSDENVTSYSVAGRALGELPLPAEPAPVTNEGIESFLRHAARRELGAGSDLSTIDFAERAHEAKAVFGRHAPAFVDIRCEPGGGVWLQRFDLTAHPLGRSSEWLYATADGHLRSIRFPSAFRPLVFDGLSAVGVVETVEGEALATWRISSVEAP